ncbi:MAG: hypothetical protein VCE75_17290 [Alphaproteobacteria bacterium]
MKNILQKIVVTTKKTTTFDALGDSLVAVLTSHIPFDRLNIGLIDLDLYQFNDVYVFGHNVDGRKKGHLRTLKNTVVEASIKTGGGYFFGTSEPEQWLKRFPNFGPVLKSGIRSMLSVPVNANDKTIAALVLAARDPEAYKTDSLIFANATVKIITPKIEHLRLNMIHR